MTTLERLERRWGLSASEIARAADMPQSAVRKWRKGVEPNVDEVARADLLDDLLDDLHDLGIAEPAAWMGERFAEGFTVTRWDLYLARRYELLKANAGGEVDDVEMLGMFDPDWRRTYWTSSTTFLAEDGHLSIREKTYDEIRQQIA